jgi:hypothetical protein
MTIDPQKLEHARSVWSRIDLVDMYYAQRNMWSLHDIAESLEKMGLDLAQDATYELLEDGLTKAAFDKAVVIASVRHVNNEYYTFMGGGSHEFVEQHFAKRMYGIERLLDFALAHAEDRVAQQGMPPELSVAEQRQFVMIQDLHRSGALKEEMQCAAAGMAICEFRAALRNKDAIEKTKPGEPVSYESVRTGLGRIDRAMEAVEKAGAHYQPCEVLVDRGIRGLNKNGCKVAYSREAVEELRTYFLVRQLGMQFERAKMFQDQGHFVLDSTSGGFGAMVMPMQEILTKLQAYGKDIADKETYRAIGTEKDIFWACYQRERAEVQKNDQYKLLKPEFKI